MAWKHPVKGACTVQEYHPERGIRYERQVSTYNGDSWLIDFCSIEDVAKVKAQHMEELSQCLK